MTNPIMTRLNRTVVQTFRALHEVSTVHVQRVRYASAMGHYTPSHRARHQMLAWHAATKQAEEMRADALDEIAMTSKAAIEMENKATLKESGSVAATNVALANGLGQKREFSTTSSRLKSKSAKIGRVSSDETMSTDTTFATSSSSTHTTSGSSPEPKKSTAASTSRSYSSKPEKTPYEKHLTDEEHRLQEGLIRGDNLMSQDEGMNSNEDKEGMRIHPASTHHNRNDYRHKKKKAFTSSGSPTGASGVPGESPAGKPLASAANPGGGVGATRSYATKAKPKAVKEGVDNLKGEMVKNKKPATSTSSATSGSASVAAKNPGESPAGTPAASAAHVGGGVGGNRAYATSAKGKETVGEAILKHKGDFTNLINIKKLTEDKKTSASASIPATSPGESPAGTPAASAAHVGGGVGAIRAYSTTAKSTKAKRQEAERHAPEIVSGEGQFLNTNEIKGKHELPDFPLPKINKLPKKAGVEAGAEEAGNASLRHATIDKLNAMPNELGEVGTPNHHHHKGHHKKPPTSTAATKRKNYPASMGSGKPYSTRAYSTTSKGLSERNNMTAGVEDAHNARAKEESRIVDRNKESPNRAHHQNQHKKPHSSTAAGTIKSRNYATSTKSEKHAPKEHIDEMRDERLMNKDKIKVESYEYTRSGTDNEVAVDPEAYCREHLHPEEELGEEERNKKAHNHPGHNPLQFSPANADVSKPPKHSDLNEVERNAKEQKSGPGKTRKGHKIGTRLGDEKFGGEHGL